MKKMILIVLAMIISSVCYAQSVIEPAGFQVSTNSITIMPRIVTKAKDWVTGTGYKSGDLVRNPDSQKLIYWNAYPSPTNHTATSTNPPSHLNGDAYDDSGLILWRRIQNVDRSGFSIVNADTNTIFLAIGNDAVLNGGIALYPNGGSFGIDYNAFQHSVQAICSVVSNLVVVIEW